VSTCMHGSKEGVIHRGAHLWKREQGAVVSTCMLGIPGLSMAARTEQRSRGRNCRISV